MFARTPAGAVHRIPTLWNSQRVVLLLSQGSRLQSRCHGEPFVSNAGVTRDPGSSFCQPQVSRGYGRGSKKLGVATANLPESQFAENLRSLPAGNSDEHGHRFALVVAGHSYFHGHVRFYAIRCGS